MISNILRIIWGASLTCLWAFKFSIFPRKCFVVTSSYSGDVTTAGIFTEIKVFSLRNFSTKIYSLTGYMVFQILTIICSPGSSCLCPLKYNIIPRKCFVVTSSYIAGDTATDISTDIVINIAMGICVAKFVAIPCIAISVHGYNRGNNSHHRCGRSQRHYIPFLTNVLFLKWINRCTNIMHVKS